ncbi:MAG: type II CRISPR-associated endonuclease Cas1 [Clostridia bacterium]|nr:type II CRISPR-associated endonuclease Cas1 [Clostridia bacterium]
MSFRTVVIKSRAKLEVRLNALIVRGESEKKIFINEISTLIIQSTAVSLTAALLNELIKNNVKVMFCDEKCNPSAELLPYYTSYNSSKKIKRQIEWTVFAKGNIWSEIIKQKILRQSEYLFKRGFEEQAKMLLGYASEVEYNDRTNREGHSAKVYFNCILGKSASRKDDGFLNSCLNYGYSVILSAFNREIVASGYLTQLGIWHNNEFNEFNLACDLMEPLRVIVDELACLVEYNDKNFKKIMANVLNFETNINGKTTTLDIAIKTYVRSCFTALEKEDKNLIIFPEKTVVKNEL